MRCDHAHAHSVGPRLRVENQVSLRAYEQGVRATCKSDERGSWIEAYLRSERRSRSRNP